MLIPPELSLVLTPGDPADAADAAATAAEPQASSAPSKTEDEKTELEQQQKQQDKQHQQQQQQQQQQQMARVWTRVPVAQGRRWSPFQGTVRLGVMPSDTSFPDEVSLHFFT